jgi:ubiquinone/menaquinone biosynthesis C-methylase UbiE
MDSKLLFSNKVDNYVKYRPMYPKEYFDYLVDITGISRFSVIADIGAGTGIFTKQIADKVKKVYAVEPNPEMRSACQIHCGDADNIDYIDGSAENTTLKDNNVDHITAAQSFHWFDPVLTKAEFQRILRPGGKVALVWNIQDAENGMIKENDAICRRYCPAFIGFGGGSSNKKEIYGEFFRNGKFDHRVLENNINNTLDSYIGGSLSASYAPKEGDKNYVPFISSLTELFEKYNTGGRLMIPVNTCSYVGEI